MSKFFGFIMMIILIQSSIKADLIDQFRCGTIAFKDTSTGFTHTIPSVKSDLVGLITDGSIYGRLTQTFINPLSTPLEATYVFPLPEYGAVHGMAMITSNEIIHADIKEKNEAQAIYDSAKAEGKSAALLVQNRPNIFSQNVANIAPGESIAVIITYTAPLKYDNGTYEMAFPTTIGPRFTPPGGPTVAQPSYSPPTTRSAEGLQIRLLMVTGFHPSNITSPLHPITVSTALSHVPDIASLGFSGGNLDNILSNAKWIELTRDGMLQNKDFILRFDRPSAGLDYSFSCYRNTAVSDTGHFSFTVFPSLEELGTTGSSGAPPKEMAIMVDVSGSTSGAVLTKEKELAYAMINKLAPGDFINVMKFSYSVSKCFPNPLPATATNIQTARNYISSMSSGGGTMILPAVDATLTQPGDTEMQKIVVFITDAYVSNEQQVLERIQNNTIQNLTFFSFGVGNSVNRYLIEEMGRLGNGAGQVLTLNDQVQPIVDEFWKKVRGPQLWNTTFDFGTAKVADINPASIKTVFAGQPITMLGKYTNPGKTTITISGYLQNGTFEHKVPVHFRKYAPFNRSLPKLWARKLISDLDVNPTSNKQQITDLGLKYSIMTQYTSFVALSKEITNPSLKYTSQQIAALWPDGVDPFLGGDPFVIKNKPVPPSGYQVTVNDNSYYSGSTTYPPPAYQLTVNPNSTGYVTYLNDFPHQEPKPFTDVLVKISPNPSPGLITFTFDLKFDQKISVGIFTLEGKLVESLFDQTMLKGSHVLTWNGSLQSGVYWLRIENQAGLMMRRIVITQ